MSGPTLKSMSSAVKALGQEPPSAGGRHRRRRVAVVTDEASLGTAAVAALAGTSARAPDLRQQTEMRIRHCAPPAASVRDFVDLTRACSAPSLEAAVGALADDPGCDAVLIALGTDDPARATALVGAARRVGRGHPGTMFAIVCPAVRHDRGHRDHGAADAGEGGHDRGSVLHPGAPPWSER
ncbi:hypothetical protein ABEG17_17240 [Pedococcus sp. KACC 23699]|uniref:Uncharacterized protein n=1 Tax=Pedococcus sp. KACC 23699 TaxID=3149228 RepID=A0AAU7JSL2_9MICO